MNLKELRAKRAAIIAALESLNNEMTGYRGKAEAEADEAKKAEYLSGFKLKASEFDAKTAELSALDADISRAVIIENAKAAAAPDLEGKTANPDGQPGAQRPVVEIIHNRDKEQHEELQAFGDFLNGKANEKTYNVLALPDRFSGSAHAKNAVRVPRSVGQFVMPGVLGKTPLLSTDATAPGSTGGSMLIPTIFKPELLREPVYIPAVADLVKRIPAQHGNATWPKLYQASSEFGGVAVTWGRGENSNMTESNPNFEQFTMSTHEVHAITPISIAMLNRSAIDLASLVSGLFADALRKSIGNMVVNGTGSGQPLGVAHSSSGALTQARQVLAQVSLQDIINLKNKLPFALRPGGSYVLSADAEAYLEGQTDGTGRPLFGENTSTGMRERLWGRSYLAHDFAEPDLGDRGDVIYGNWQHYMLGVEDDMAIASSEHYLFNKGQVAFRLMAHIGGKPWTGNAFAVLKAEIS